MRPHGSPKELERRRLRALDLLRRGMAPAEVAREVGVDRRSVRRWSAAHRKGGERALCAKPASGRPPRLTDRQRAALRTELVRGAQAAGFPTDLWTCPRVARLIEDRFGVTYHEDHVGRLLHALGFSPQKPVRRAGERDEKAIRRWTEHTWRRIKKKPGG